MPQQHPGQTVTVGRALLNTDPSPNATTDCGGADPPQCDFGCPWRYFVCMVSAASLSLAHRRLRDGGVLVVLVWVAFHLLGCMHSHGPAFESRHHQLTTLSVGAAAVAAPDSTTASSPEHVPCCPETGDHTVDRIRADAPSPLALGGALSVGARPDSPAAALTGAGAARAPDRGAVGGRCILTTLCVART